MKTLEAKFLDFLRGKEEHVWLALFEILNATGYSFLKEVVKNFSEQPTEGWWFSAFHKSFRTVDNFHNICVVKQIKLPEGEQKELERYKERIINIQETPAIRDWRNAVRKKPFYARYRYLVLKNRATESETVGYHLDNVIWWSIYNDKENKLYNLLNEFLKENT